jgi:hypothetical protein
VGDERFIDIDYQDLLKDSVGQARRVFAGLGLELDAEGEASIRHWLEENARDHRAAHSYTIADFGLSEAQLRQVFERYIRQFIEPSGVCP